MILYEQYKLSLNTLLLLLCLACTCFYVIGYIFFKSIIVSLLFSSAGFLIPNMRRDHLQQKRVTDLNVQFRQALYILSSSLAAGHSVEIAFRQANNDLRHLFPDEKADIRIEFNTIVKRLDNGESIETIMQNFSARTKLEDIQSFTDVFIICKRSGGNLVEVMRNTANIISEKISIQEEIAVMVAQKKLESKILSITPIIFVAVLSYSSPDYMAPLYAGEGRIIMAVALALLSLCYYVSKKMMEINI